MSSASRGSGTRRRMKLCSRDRSRLTTSEIRWSCSRLIRSRLAAPFIWACRRFGGCEYCRGLRNRTREIALLAMKRRRQLALREFGGKQTAPASKESWDVSRAALPRSLLSQDISFCQETREWHQRGGCGYGWVTA